MDWSRIRQPRNTQEWIKLATLPFLLISVALMLFHPHTDEDTRGGEIIIQAITVSLNPCDDTYVDSNNPGATHGSSGHLYVEDPDRGHGNKDAYFEYNLSPYAYLSELNVSITYAEFGDATGYTYASGYIDFYCGATDWWNESEVNWTNKPSANSWFAYTYETAEDPFVYHSGDKSGLRSCVYNAITSSNHYVTIRASSTNDYYGYFRSKEDAPGSLDLKFRYITKGNGTRIRNITNPSTALQNSVVSIDLDLEDPDGIANGTLFINKSDSTMANCSLFWHTGTIYRCNFNDTSQTGLYRVKRVEIYDNLGYFTNKSVSSNFTIIPFQLTLNSPPNNTISVGDTLVANYTITGENITYTCRLYVDSALRNESAVGNGTHTFSITLPHNRHEWYITCNTTTSISSERRIWSNPYIKACQSESLNSSNFVYYLYGNISGSGAYCLNMSGANSTLDCRGNRINGSGTGILITGANVTIRNCEIWGLDCGINISAGASGSWIYNNTFNNTINLEVPATSENKLNASKTASHDYPLIRWNYGGNLWLSPNGDGHSEVCNDTDCDHICDEPYQINENNTDYLPLIYLERHTFTPDSIGITITELLMNESIT